MEIEYNLTLEDEIARLEIDRDYISKLPLLYWQNGYIISIALLIGNTPYIWTCLTTDVGFYTGFEGASVSSTFLNLLLTISLIPQVKARLPWRNSIAKYRIKKLRFKNPKQVKRRKLILSDTEFTIDRADSYSVLRKETKTSSHSWDELKRYFEDDRGFYLDFSERERYFIPRRVFANQNEINKLARLLRNGRK